MHTRAYMQVHICKCIYASAYMQVHFHTFPSIHALGTLRVKVPNIIHAAWGPQILDQEGNSIRKQVRTPIRYALFGGKQVRTPHSLRSVWGIIAQAF